MQFQKFQNEFFEFFVFSVDFQPHHVEAGARLHLFFHDLGKIALDIGIVDIRVEIGVARDAHHHSAARGVTGKGVVSERAHEFFERHEARLFAPADTVQPVERGVERHHAHHVPPVPFEIVQHVVFHVFELHQRVFRVQHHQ